MGRTQASLQGMHPSGGLITNATPWGSWQSVLILTAAPGRRVESGGVGAVL